MKLEIPSSEFSPIFGDWGKLGIPNLERMSQIKCDCCKMPGLLRLFYRFWVIKGKPIGGRGGEGYLPSPTRLGLIG